MYLEQVQSYKYLGSTVNSGNSIEEETQYRITLGNKAYLFCFLWRCGPTRAMASPFLRFLDHTQRLITVGRTPLDGWSARRRDLYLTTHNTHNRQTSMPPVGFEPTISASERPQTYALDRAATGIGNKAYYANRYLCRSTFVSKKSKLKLYWIIISPIVTYACKVWVFKETIKNKLMVFERKLLRKIFGPTKERDGMWRIKTNDELDALIRHKNIINHIQTQRLSWFGHLHRMPEERMVKKVCKWKPMSIRPQGRPKNTRDGDIRSDMKKLKIKNCIKLHPGSNKWKSYVE